MEIVTNDRMAIPLYHGTSSLFEASIRKHGLGAIDPATDYEALDFLKRAYEIASMHIPVSELEWARERHSLKLMVNQSSTGRLNWQHGSVFLTPSFFTASNYARGNCVGSELLSYAVWLYGLLLRHSPEELSSELEDSPITDLVHESCGPIVVTAHSVSTHALKSEQGESPTEVINMIERVATNDQDLNDICQQFNFRCREVIPPDQLEFTPLKRER